LSEAKAIEFQAGKSLATAHAAVDAYAVPMDEGAATTRLKSQKSKASAKGVKLSLEDLNVIIDNKVRAKLVEEELEQAKIKLEAAILDVAAKTKEKDTANVLYDNAVKAREEAQKLVLQARRDIERRAEEARLLEMKAAEEARLLAEAKAAAEEEARLLAEAKAAAEEEARSLAEAKAAAEEEEARLLAEAKAAAEEEARSLAETEAKSADILQSQPKTNELKKWFPTDEFSFAVENYLMQTTRDVESLLISLRSEVSDRQDDESSPHSNYVHATPIPIPLTSTAENGIQRLPPPSLLRCLSPPQVNGHGIVEKQAKQAMTVSRPAAVESFFPARSSAAPIFDADFHLASLLYVNFAEANDLFPVDSSAVASRAEDLENARLFLEDSSS
jgi:hypothetical protein